MENDQRKKETELKSNRKRDERKPYMVHNGNAKEDLKYYDSGDLETMRAMGYGVRREIDPLRKIKSIEYMPNSNIVCELCEETTEETKKIYGVHKGNYRVDYEEDKEGKSKDKGKFVLVCNFHKPVKEEEGVAEETHNSWDWTDH